MCSPCGRGHSSPGELLSDTEPSAGRHLHEKKHNLCSVFRATVDEAAVTAGSVPHGGGGGTFGAVAPVLLLPLVQQQVLVARTLEEAEVAGRRRRREGPLEASAATQLVLALRQHADVLGGQDVQHRGQEVLWQTGSSDQ